VFTVPEYHGFLRRCWRSGWFSKVPMVVFPQKVSSYGFFEQSHLGEAVCLGCGKKHHLHGAPSEEL